MNCWKRTLMLGALVLGSAAFAATKSPGEIRDSLSVSLGGGLEGYTGNLNNRVNPGPAWGATIGVQPLTWMGAEIGYTGAVNEVKNSVVAGEGLANGSDIVRNGGQVAATFNLPTPYVQPYAVVGLGVDHYTVRGSDLANAAVGFQSDTAGRVPIGGGLRAKVGPFNADARFAYDALFDDEFSSSGGTATTGGAYTGMIQLGGRF